MVNSIRNNKWLILGLLALAQFMVVLDVSIVNVALPAIQKGLHFKPNNLQWVVTAYSLAIGGFLLFGGRAADLYGRRRVFLAGVTGFTLASMVVGISHTSTIMVAARAVQGLSAAFMSPAALSIVLTTFREGSDRNKALGVWSAVAAGGAAAGVLLGGLLTQYLGWRWDFFVNVPVGLFVFFMSLATVPAHAAEEKDTNLDLPGAVLVTSGLMALVYGLTQAPTWGWGSHKTLEFLGGAVVLLVGFIINEARAKHPLMPLSIFRIRNVTGADLTQLPIAASLFSMFFFVSLYVQTVLNYSPVKSGLGFLPVTFIIGILATIISGRVTRYGYKPFMVAAPLFMALGLWLMSHMQVGGSYIHDVFPGLAIMAVGLGMSFVSITIAATSGVPAEESGLASGLLNTSQQVGGAIGLAVLSDVASSKLTKVLAASPDHSPLAIARATVDGFHSAFHVAIGFALLAAFFALTIIKQQPREAAEKTGAPARTVVEL